MSLIKSFNLLQTNLPSLVSKRFRGKINIQRPRAPHYERARVLAVTQPAYKSQQKDERSIKDVAKCFYGQSQSKYTLLFILLKCNFF